MTLEETDLRDAHPLAWTFHRNTSRFAFNTLETDEGHYQSAPKEYPSAPFRPLPPPRVLHASLQEVLQRRVTCRCYASTSLALDDLSTLLVAAYGITGRTTFGSLEFLERPVPSAGGLYPLELYVLARRVEKIEPGIYHYAVVGHGLEQVREVLVPRALNDYLFMGQHYATDAAATVVIAAEGGRTLGKYGDRGYRYVLLEAGHCAQNLNLAAVALGLGTCNLGGFFDQELGHLMTLDPEREVPLYGVAVGLPATSDKDSQRGIEKGG